MKTIFRMSAVLLFVWCSVGLPATVQGATAPAGDTLITARIFPLANLIEHDPTLASAIKKEKTLMQIQKDQHRRVKDGLKQCETVTCYADAIQWPEADLSRAGDALVQLYSGNTHFQKQVAVLKKRGSYSLFNDLADTTYLRKAWNQDASGINRIFAVYIKGEKPRYFKIDSISFGPADPQFRAQVREVLQAGSARGTFLSLPLSAVTKTLKINGRQEMIQYEPLKAGLNDAPYQKINSTDWSKYKYSVILVPGLGPEIPGQRLDPNGAKRCDEGLKRYKAGLAPFIVVSGGNVHPFKTPYNEAEEMKKYLVAQGVPDEVIFIEPYARHTTTNLRNLNRMIFRFGIPTDKPVLIVTDESQSKYIVERMEKTAVRDLGYVPYKGLKKLSLTETEYFPNAESLHTDSIDPLDP